MTTEFKIKWNKGTYTEVPHLPNCDVCATRNETHIAKYDSKTKSGKWAFLCPMHFEMYGSGLGYGKGQMLIVKKGFKNE